MGSVAEILIGFHQKVISPADGPRSHFLPSSSQYTLDAMRKYGFFKGVAMGCDRLMRENNEEWVYQTGYNCAGQKMKLDPVR
ncbi:MAG: membrane protein insertion efficiency factor YidD [Parachlamydiaceae bacterium]|nr:membrane protein insertion efficiency factor YidD [Parachlamydiaceae bacterium]